VGRRRGRKLEAKAAPGVRKFPPSAPAAVEGDEKGLSFFPSGGKGGSEEKKKERVSGRVMPGRRRLQGGEEQQRRRGRRRPMWESR